MTFDLSKIENAIKAANNEVDKLHQLNEYQVHAIADNLEKQIESMSHAVHVEDIQDMVETGIMEMRGYEVAQNMCVTVTRESSHVSPTPRTTESLRS